MTRRDEPYLMAIDKGPKEMELSSVGPKTPWVELYRSTSKLPEMTTLLPFFHGGDGGAPFVAGVGKTLRTYECGLPSQVTGDPTGP